MLAMEALSNIPRSDQTFLFTNQHLYLLIFQIKQELAERLPILSFPNQNNRLIEFLKRINYLTAIWLNWPDSWKKNLQKLLKTVPEKVLK